MALARGWGHAVVVKSHHRTHAKDGGTHMNDYFKREGLVRPRDGRVLGGVCAGLGRRFGLTPWQARILFVLVLMLIPGSQVLIYPVLWILMPSEQPAAPISPRSA
jgi:phage shock protein PspC (stress-responsive transcriptional regulator)